MHFKLNLLSVLAVLVFLLGSCQKDEPAANDPVSNTGNTNAAIDCKEHEAFCTAVSMEELEETGPIIDEVLAQINAAHPNDESQQMNRLKAWLQCQSCVEQAEVVCVSCIEVLPPWSELRIQFTTNSGMMVRVMDVSMDDPPVFVRYHE